MPTTTLIAEVHVACLHIFYRILIVYLPLSQSAAILLCALKIPSGTFPSPAPLLRCLSTGL